MSDMKQDRGTADLSMQLAHVDCVIVQLWADTISMSD